MEPERFVTVTKFWPPILVFNKMNPVVFLPLELRKISFNIILPSASRFCEWFFS
jgi:hypothetical protein